MASKKLCIVALGEQNSGKTTLWKNVKKREINNILKMGYHDIEVKHKLIAKTFMIPASPQETQKTLEGILEDKCKNNPPDILLCSIQYCDKAKLSFKFLEKSGYDINVFWLNPGYASHNNGKKLYTDDFGLQEYVESLGGHFNIAKSSAKSDSNKIATEVRNKIFDWSVDNFI